MRRKTELICAATVAATSLLAVFLILPRLNDHFFVWSGSFGPAVASACGRGFAEFRTAVPTLPEFLNRTRVDFDCRLIPANAALGPVDAYASGIPYFLKALGLYWRLTGVSWPALAPAFGVLFALSNTLLFLLFREFLGAAFGCAVALAYVFFPSNYTLLTHYEHYTKAPFFVAIVLLMVWLARRRISSRQLVTASVAGGILCGIGAGIRADLWLLTILFVVTVLFFARGELRPRSRWLACLVFGVTCAAAALPALRVQGPSYFWLQLIEGLASPFDEDLSVQRGIYAWMPHYNDNLALNWIQTHAYYQNGGTVAALDRYSGARDEPAPGVMDWPARETAGRRAYLAITRYFPADFVTRPLAAVLTILRQSFSQQPRLAGEYEKTSFFTRTAPVWAFLGAASAVPLFAVVAAIAGVAVDDRRRAIFYLLLVLYLGGMTAIVFIPRHRWHLYFIGLLAVAAVARFLFRHARRIWQAPAQTGRQIGGALAFVLLIAGVGAGVIVATRAWQDRTVGRLVDGLLVAGKDAVPLSRVVSQDMVVFEATKLIERFHAQDHAGGSGYFQYGDYLMATFPRQGCSAATVKALFHASAPYFDDSEDVALAFPDGSMFFRVIFPALQMHNNKRFAYFRGLQVADGCVPRLERFRDPAALPFLIEWHLPEQWRSAPRHQTITF